MSDCSCVFVTADCLPSVVTETKPKARKVHKCTECRRDIVPGEIYEKVHGCWEGEFETYKTCPDCLALRDEFFCNGWCFGDTHEHLMIHVQEVDGEIPEKCIVGLPPGAREILFKMIEVVWKDIEDLEED